VKWQKAAKQFLPTCR